MKIQNLNKIVDEIKEEGKNVENKDDWWAGKGKHSDFGNDWFLGHPKVGLYQFKSYKKNPYTTKGVGTKLTKNVDNDIKENFEKDSDTIFGVLPDKIKKSRKRRTEKLLKKQEFNDPSTLFKKILDGLGINIRGKLTHSSKNEPEPVKNLKGTFDEEQKQLTEEFKKILNNDDVYNPYI